MKHLKLGMIQISFVQIAETFLTPTIKESVAILLFLNPINYTKWEIKLNHESFRTYG